MSRLHKGKSIKSSKCTKIIIKSAKIYGNNAQTRLILPIGPILIQDCFLWLTVHSDFWKRIYMKERFSSYLNWSNQVE